MTGPANVVSSTGGKRDAKSDAAQAEGRETKHIKRTTDWVTDSEYRKEKAATGLRRHCANAFECLSWLPRDANDTPPVLIGTATEKFQMLIHRFRQRHKHQGHDIGRAKD